MILSSSFEPPFFGDNCDGDGDGTDAPSLSCGMEVAGNGGGGAEEKDDRDDNMRHLGIVRLVRFVPSTAD